jgi:regulator-associated protein of mTOR
MQSSHSIGILTSDAFARSTSPSACDLPGIVSDKTTPLGFLDWVLTSVVDAIAFECVPLRRFQRLFREDVTLAGLCRNFFVAQRVMR